VLGDFSKCYGTSYWPNSRVFWCQSLSGRLSIQHCYGASCLRMQAVADHGDMSAAVCRYGRCNMEDLFWVFANWWLTVSRLPTSSRCWHLSTRPGTVRKPSPSANSASLSVIYSHSAYYVIISYNFVLCILNTLNPNWRTSVFVSLTQYVRVFGIFTIFVDEPFCTYMYLFCYMFVLIWLLLLLCYLCLFFAHYNNNY